MDEIISSTIIMMLRPATLWRLSKRHFSFAPVIDQNLLENIKNLEESATKTFLADVPTKSLQTLRKIIQRDSIETGYETRHINLILDKIIKNDFKESLNWYNSMNGWKIPPNTATYKLLLYHACEQSSWDPLFYILADMRLNKLYLNSSPDYIEIIRMLIEKCRMIPQLRWRYALTFFDAYKSFLPIYVGSPRDFQIFQNYSNIIYEIIYNSLFVTSSYMLIKGNGFHNPSDIPQLKTVFQLNSTLQNDFFDKFNVHMDAKYFSNLGIFMILQEKGELLEKMISNHKNLEMLTSLPHVVSTSSIDINISTILEQHSNNSTAAIKTLSSPSDRIYNMLIDSLDLEMEGIKIRHMDIAVGWAYLIAENQTEYASNIWMQIENKMNNATTEQSIAQSCKLINETMIILSKVFRLLPNNQTLLEIYRKFIGLSASPIQISDGKVIRTTNISTIGKQIGTKKGILLNKDLADDMIKTFQLYKEAESALSLVFLCESIGFAVSEDSYIAISSLLLDRQEYNLVVELFDLFKSRQSLENLPSRYKKKTNVQKKTILFPVFEKYQSFYSVLVALGELRQPDKLILYFDGMAEYKIQPKMSIFSAVINGFRTCGRYRSGILFFRKVFRLEIPQHLAPIPTDDSVHKFIFVSKYEYNTKGSNNYVIHQALRCCAEGKLGKDAIDLIAYSESRAQSDRRMAELDIGSSIQDWELVMLAISTKTNIALIPQVLSVMTCMDRPISATKQLLKVCLASCVAIGDETSTASVLLTMKQSGFIFDQLWIEECARFGVTHFGNSVDEDATNVLRLDITAKISKLLDSSTIEVQQSMQ